MIEKLSEAMSTALEGNIENFISYENIGDSLLPYIYTDSTEH